MQPALFDTSIYISALRRGRDAVLVTRRLAANAPLWLSSVVLEELYAGAGDRERRVVERLERDFDRVKRILVPNISDWTQAGKVLARLAAKYGYEHIGRGGWASSCSPPMHETFVGSPNSAHFSGDWPMSKIGVAVRPIFPIGPGNSK